MAETDDVQLPDLQVIQRYSLAVRGATAPREDVIAALQADLDWLSGGGRRRSPVKAAPADAPRITSSPAPASRTAATPGRQPAAAKSPARPSVPAKRPAPTATRAPAKKVGKAPAKKAAKAPVKKAGKAPAKRPAAGLFFAPAKSAAKKSPARRK